MGDLLKRLFLRNPAPAKPRPDWAHFFTDGQYTLFASLVVNYFQDRGQKFHFDGTFVDLPDGNKEPRRLSILNLALKCAPKPAKQWQSVIDSHFDTSWQVAGQVAALLQKDFSTIQETLAVQLYPPEGCTQDAIVSREDLPGLTSVLVFNLPGATQQVSRVDAAGWGKSWDELFEIGHKNVFRQCKPTKNNLVKLGDIASVAVFEGDEFFTATFALAMDKRKDLIGPLGSLIAVPRGGTLLCHALAAEHSGAACKLLSILLDEANRLGPYSLNKEIYWYQDRNFYHGVEWAGTGKDLKIVSPPALVEAIVNVPTHGERG